MQLLLLLGGLALAQTPPQPSTPTPTTPPAAAPASDAALLRAIELPRYADKLRDAGVPEAEVKSSLGAMKDAGVPAGDAAEVTEATATDIETHGPIDNFGAFVQEKLASGLRGQELAAAIKAEHAARGKGKPDHAGGPPEGKGPDGAHPGRGGEGGKGPGDHGHEGKAGEHGRSGAGDAHPAPGERGGGREKQGDKGNGKAGEKENHK